MLIGTKQQHAKLSDNTTGLKFCSSNIKPVNQVRNLGVIFDSELSLKNHVTKTSQISFMLIRHFRQIRDHLDKNSAKLFANAVISSKLDASLFYNLNKTLLHKMQLVQNILARVVFKTSERVAISHSYRKIYTGFL